MRFALCFVFALGSLGCADGPRPLIEAIAPPAFSTALGPDPELSLRLAEGASWALEAGSDGLVLLDLSDSRQAIPLGGTLTQQGQSVRFVPKRALRVPGDFAWVLQREAIAGLCAGPPCVSETLRERDASEWPEEALSWPLWIPFSTRSAPRMRAIYLRQGRWLYLRFSQAMERVATEQAVSVLDGAGKTLPLLPGVWQDREGRNLRLELAAPLEATGLYRLQLSDKARGAAGEGFDGDGDGVIDAGGESLRVRFTGSQTVALSRMAGHATRPAN